jgi:hypothetical protein
MGPSSTPTLTPSRTRTATITSTPSQTPTGTLPTPTPSYTPSQTPTRTPTFTPTQTASATSTATHTQTPTPTPEPQLSFTIEFVSHYSCQQIEFLTFKVENSGDLPLEYSKVRIIDLGGPQEITNSFTNWPFQSLPDGCANDLGMLPSGQTAYLPIPIIESENAPPPYPGEHQGTFTFCSENYYLEERGTCRAEVITFTVP